MLLLHHQNATTCQLQLSYYVSICETSDLFVVMVFNRDGRKAPQTFRMIWLI